MGWFFVGFFFHCPSSVCSSWTLSSAKSTLFHGVVILIYPPQCTYLVVKTQGEREFQVPVWNGRAQLFSACKKVWGLAKGTMQVGPLLFFFSERSWGLREEEQQLLVCGKKTLHPHTCQLLQLSELSFVYTFMNTQCQMHLSHCSHVPWEPF